MAGKSLQRGATNRSILTRLCFCLREPLWRFLYRLKREKSSYPEI